MNRKIVGPIVLLLLIAGLGVMAVRSGWLKQDDPNRLLVSGNIELTQVDISFKVPGKLVERAVDEGQFVKKGQLIARIDRDQMDRQRQRDTAGVDSARFQFDQTRTSIEYQEATLAADIDLKKADVRQAQAHLDELLAGSRPQEIQQARAAVTDAKAQYDQAKLDWDRAQTLYKNDDISTSQFDQFRTRFNSTAALLKQAEERLALTMEGPRKEDIESARAQVAHAQAALKLSEASRLEVQRRREELQGRRAETARAQAQVAITDTQLNDMVVNSPVDGVVLVKSAEPGEVLAAGTSVVTIGDIDHPWLRGYINERDLGRVKIGSKARVTSDSYPGKEYWGRVGFISADAEFTPKQIQTKEERVKLVYRIKIDVDNPRRELKSNMPVEAEILLEQQ
jgi:HlyD family secretion protein